MTNEKDLLAKLEAVLKINDMLVSENEKQKQMIESMRSNGHRNVAVGCNAVYGITLQAPNGEIEIDLQYGDVTSIADDDIKTLLKRNSTRKLFISGIVYFIDESEYANFGIRRKISINDEKIVEVFNANDKDALKNYLDEATGRKYDLNVMNTLFYKIVLMNMSGKLGNIPYDLRTTVEDYFNMKLDMAETLYRRVKSVM